MISFKFRCFITLLGLVNDHRLDRELLFVVAFGLSTVTESVGPLVCVDTFTGLGGLVLSVRIDTSTRLDTGGGKVRSLGSPISWSRC